MHINRSYTTEADPLNDETLQRLVEDDEADVSARKRMCAVVLLMGIVAVCAAVFGGIMHLLTK